MVKGSKHTEKSRAKMSAALLGHSNNSPKQRAHIRKIGLANKGRIHTPESRANMAAAGLAKRRHDAGYIAAHMRVRRARGPASGYFCECGRPAQHWAFLWRETPKERWMKQVENINCIYSLNINDYAAMCARCASWYDKDQILREFVEEGRL